MEEKYDLKEILATSTTISDIARHIFGNPNYTNRKKCKKILEENSIDWEAWLSSKKKPPTFCLYCGKEIKSRDKYRQKFCCRSCARSYCNHQRSLTNAKKYCLNCGIKIEKRSKYCSNKCQVQYETKQLIEQWKNGNESGCYSDGSIKKFLRNYLLIKNNYKCEECGFDKFNQYTNSSVLQIHHIDGNCFNNQEENLKVLCPNCHSLTYNYGSRNKNSHRVDKRLKRYKKL